MLERRQKGGLWAIWAFYFLIAFEIVYMITPFGIYYYSVYGKGLLFLNHSAATSWLTAFFLPHYAATSSAVLNTYKIVGWIIAPAGFLLFCIGAGQIYYSKFRNRKAVTGGIYNFIRHPQYASLAVCSFGLLLVWPRYLVLIMFITMLFAYYFLARAEERECEERFGASYIEYKKRTSMFLPLPFGELPRLLPVSGVKRYAAILALYLAALASSVYTAQLLKEYSIRSLYAAYSEHSATIALADIGKNRLNRVMAIAAQDNGVRARLAGMNGQGAFLNYVLPAEWFFPDVPMNDWKGIGEHYTPDHYDADRYRILFMQAKFRPDAAQPEGTELISRTVKRNPLIEVEVSLKENRVLRIDDPPATVVWGDIPTPLF